MNGQATVRGDQAHRFYGKYRGKVLDNIDPLFQGRILAEVPAIAGSLMNWALPCVPYAGADVGFYAMPPVGANIWIEFEGGDPGYPIWAGCFWGPEDVLHVPEPAVPELKIFKTDFTTIVINDLPAVGGFSVRCMPPAVDVPLTMTFDSTGITLECPESTIKMTPGSITLSVPESAATITPASIILSVPETIVTLTPELASIAVPSSSIGLMPEAIEIESPLVSVTGELNSTPVVTIEGDANVALLLSVEGDANVAGALTVEGGVAIEGGGEIDGAPII